MLEKRLTTRLTAYWDILRKEYAMPEFAALNKGKIDDIWPYCIVFKLEPGVDNDDRTFLIHDMGAKLIELYCENLIGKRITKKHKQFKASSLIKQAGQIITAPSQLEDEGKFINDRNKVVKYRSCLVPFGNPASGEVSHLLAGMSWREF